MGLDYRDLDARTRRLMLQEIDHDIAAGTLYLSSNLNARGRGEFSDLLRRAAAGGTDDVLAAEIRSRLNAHEPPRPLRSGGFSKPRIMRSNAHEMLAEGEFNRFYIRALCLRAIEDDIGYLVIYRAKVALQPRPESERRIGQTVPPRPLLEDLRTHPGVETALGVPGGPSSGLSVRLPRGSTES